MGAGASPGPSLVSRGPVVAGWVALGLTAVGLAACGVPGAGWLEDAEYLQPGRTTVASLRAPRAAARAEGASADRDQAPLGADLHALVTRLLQRSPAVAASRARAKAAIERVPQASTLPRPTLRYTYLPWPVETRVGPTEHRVQLTQAIPFPTKLAARDSAARALARAAAAEHDRVVRDQLTKLKVAWADYYYVVQALHAVTQNEALARRLSELAGTRYAQGRGALFDVSKAQSQLAQLGYDRLRLTEQREVVVARLNALLGRPAQAPIEAPASLPYLEVHMSRDALLAVALAHQQELKALDERIRAAQARVREAAASWLPDLGVGVQWSLNGPARVAPGGSAPADSGQDALGVTVSLSLPLWFGDQAARVAEAKARRTAALGAKAAHLDDLQAQLADALFKERDARRLRTLYDEELLPQARRALETSEQWYRAEPARFADFLEARGVFYSFSLARARAVADQFQAVARLEQLVGAPLAPADARPQTERQEAP